MAIESYKRFIRKRIEDDLPPVEEIVWSKYERMAAVPLWKVIALACDLDPEATVRRKSKLVAMSNHILKKNTITINIPSTKFDAYKEMFLVTANCLRHQQGITVVRKSASVQLHTVNLQDFVRFADSKEWTIPNRFRLIKPKLGLDSQSVENSRPQWQIPGTYAYRVRKLAEAKRDELVDGKLIGLKKLASVVSEELKSRNMLSPRRTFWSPETVKREALTGITGRKPTGRK